MVKNLLSIFFMVAIIIIATNNPAYAIELGSEKSKVAVVLDTPGGMFSEPEKVYETLQQSLDTIFQGTSQYQILPIGETDSYVQIYREENDLTATVETPMGGTYTRNEMLKKEDIETICKHFDADYMIYVKVSSSTPRFSGGFMSASQKVNVTLDFRVWSNKKSDFAYTKRAMTTGTSTTVYAGGFGSSSHAVEKGLKKGLKEIEKDALKIKSAMID